MKSLIDSLGFLEFIDFFKEPIRLNYKSNYHNSSFLSKILSVLIYAYILYGFITSDMITKENPIIVSQTLNRPHANEIKFDQSKHFSVSLVDSDNNNIIEETIFTMSIGFFQYQNDEFGISQLINYTDIVLVPCNVSHVAFDPDLFQKLGLKNQLCLPNRDFSLQGYWDEESINVLRVSLFLCENSTNFNKCKSSDEINSFFESTKLFNIYYSTIGSDLVNFENPIQIIYRNEYFIVDVANFKKTYVYLKAAEISTNNGWYFEEKSFINDFMFDHKEIDLTTRNRESPQVAQFTLFASHNQQIDTRRYQKIDDLFGNLSGTASFFIFICMFFTKIRNDLNIVLETMNTLYSFPIKKNEKKILSQSKSNSISSKLSMVQSYAFQKIKKLMDFREKSEDSKLQIGFFSYLLGNLKKLIKLKLNRKQKLVFQAQHQYQKEMDLVNILSRLQEIDKLKKIIFNDKQYALFSYLSKPIIPLDKEEDLSIKREKLLKDFEEIKKDSEDNIMNANLIKLMDETFKEFQRNNRTSSII